MKKAIFALALLLSMSAIAGNPPCKGTTKSGQPCRSTIVSKEGYCGHHNPNGNKCGAATSKGQPCKVLVKEAGQKCRFHQ
jgi:hypothetical protein